MALQMGDIAPDFEADTTFLLATRDPLISHCPHGGKHALGGAMKCHSIARRRMLAWLALLCSTGLAQVAGAAELVVDCNDPKKLNSINAALAQVGKQGPNIIRISGTCNEAVSIENFNQITLVGNPGASINDPTPAGPGFAVVDISSSDRVALRTLTVNGGAIGVVCRYGATCRLEDVTVQGAETGAFLGSGSHMILLGNTVLQNNSILGLAVARGSSARTDPLVEGGPGPMIRNNATGVTVVDNGTLDAIQLTVQGNSPGHGISADLSGVVRLGNATISGNAGHGVNLRGSMLRVNGVVVIAGNGGSGVRVGNLSIARFLADQTITGNGQPDVNCASTTAVTQGTGNLGGGTTNCVEPQP